MLEWLQKEGGHDDMAKLLLRVAVGFLMIFHGLSKAVHGISFIEGIFSNMGLPSFLAYGVFLGEIVAPIMLIIGYRVKIASLLIISTMVVAIALAHSDEVFALGKHGQWAIELQMFYILASVSILLQGAGKYCLSYK